MTFISIFALMGFMVFLTAIIAVCSIGIDAITKAEIAKDAKAYKQAIQTIQATHDGFINKWEEAQQMNIGIINELNSFDNLINQRAKELKEILAAKRKHHKIIFA